MVGRGDRKLIVNSGGSGTIGDSSDGGCRVRYVFEVRGTVWLVLVL